MKNNIKIFLELFAAQLVGYILIVINWRSVNQVNIPIALSTDGIYACLQFFIFKKIANDKESTLWGFAGYVCGSLLGSYEGILISKHLLGK